MSKNELMSHGFRLTCPACKEDNHLIAAQQSLHKVCSHCKGYFNTLGVKRESKISQLENFNHFLPIGTEVQLKGHDWTVVGIARFAENADEIFDFWDCYFLFSPANGWCYLYESDGHFLYAQEIELFKNFSGNRYPSSIFYEEKTYSKFAYYNFQPIAASGEFPGDISEPYKSVEFIKPPYSINYYFNKQGLFAEQAEYIDRNQIKIKGEAEISWPDKPHYSHSIQPNPFIAKFKTIISLTIAFNIFWLICTIFINHNSLNQEVYAYVNIEPDTAYIATKRDTSSASNQVKVSPTFKLEDSYSNLDIVIKTNLSQSWMGMDLNLVNEGTGEVYIVAKDIEYYSGYEDGESWSEGSQTSSALLGGIPPGNYHLEHQSTYAFEKGSWPNWSVTIKKDVPVYSNWLFVAVLSLIIPFYYYYRSNYTEKKRWFDSAYNPFASDE
ncbi:MAG: DUF4178 domain-containing protein [Bacteroidia bacterium]|nr:DUF4178 domain-containing protein [Bacteroidia bacterium]